MKVFQCVVLFLFLGFLSPVLSAQSCVDQKGDVNNDGQINVLDVLGVVNHILGIVVLDEQESWRADCDGPEGNCDGDEVINILDALKIVNIILGNDVCGNTRPTASFTVNPTSGTMETVFNVDAAGSSDKEDSTALLEVRWDWESDGTCDTDWSATKTNSHQYSTSGEKVIRLEVRDSGGLVDTETHAVTVLSDSNMVTDIDGNVYHTITIGTQVWMVENLKTTRYRNGDPIQEVTVNSQWSNLSTGAYCNYDNTTSNAAVYGRLYNWYAVKDGRGIAPAGWHVPTDAEWKQLEMYLGMSQSHANATGWRGTDEGGKMKETGTIEAGTGLWHSPNTGATNSSGFTALPAGYRDYESGSFGYLGDYAVLWSSTENGSHYAWYRYLNFDHAQVSRLSYSKESGYSVRCLRD